MEATETPVPNLLTQPTRIGVSADEGSEEESGQQSRGHR